MRLILKGVQTIWLCSAEGKNEVTWTGEFETGEPNIPHFSCQWMKKNRQDGEWRHLVSVQSLFTFNELYFEICFQVFDKRFGVLAGWWNTYGPLEGGSGTGPVDFNEFSVLHEDFQQFLYYILQFSINELYWL